MIRVYVARAPTARMHINVLLAAHPHPCPVVNGPTGVRLPVGGLRLVLNLRLVTLGWGIWSLGSVRRVCHHPSLDDTQAASPHSNVTSPHPAHHYLQNITPPTCPFAPPQRTTTLPHAPSHHQMSYHPTPHAPSPHSMLDHMTIPSPACLESMSAASQLSPQRPRMGVQMGCITYGFPAIV